MPVNATKHELTLSDYRLKHLFTISESIPIKDIFYSKQEDEMIYYTIYGLEKPWIE